jgi:hypothetical protein
MNRAVRPAYDELIAELITLRAAVDPRKHARVARAADETIDAALWGREEGRESETKYDGKRIRYAARAGHSHG